MITICFFRLYNINIIISLLVYYITPQSTVGSWISLVLEREIQKKRKRVVMWLWKRGALPIVPSEEIVSFS